MRVGVLKPTRAVKRVMVDDGPNEGNERLLCQRVDDVMVGDSTTTR